MNQSVWCLVEGEREAARTGPKGYDPELPVLQCGGANVLVEHSAHVVEALACDGHSCGWQLLLAQAVEHIQCCGVMFRSWEPQKPSRSCQPMSFSWGMCGTWPYAILLLEHQPPLPERDEEGQSAGRCSRETCHVLLLSWHCFLPCLATPKQAVLPHLPQLRPPYLMEPLSSSICSRRRCASSCRAARSCCSLQMYSAVFCKVVALLTWGTMG